MALENLKNLSPKLFNDRIKPQNKSDIGNLNSNYDNIGYVAAFDRIFRPHFNGGFRTLYSPDEFTSTESIRFYNCG